MMLDKTERMNDLLDWYEARLTDKQRLIMRLYYREDFSLSEIAEHTQSSRAAVHDSLQRSEKALEELESHLGIVNRYHMRLKYYEMLRALNNSEVNTIVNQLENCDE